MQDSNEAEVPPKPPQPGTVPPANKPGDLRSVIALIIGLASLMGLCVPLFGLWLGLIGILLNILRFNSTRSWMSIPGLILSILGLAIAVATWVSSGSILTAKQ